jgi:phosphoglycerate kinase
MAFRTLDDMDIAGKRVLTRVDLNAPVRDGVVTDDTRLRAVAPTIRDILARGGKPVLLAHFDRPKGKVVPSMSLRQIAPALEAALGVPVDFAEDCVGDAVEAAARALPAGRVLLCENTRFHPGEEANDPAFAAQLARLGDVYCNDAFSAAHRAHASTEGVAHLLPACAGRLMEAELKALEKALTKPERPVVAVVGGAKVSTKLDLLGNLVGKVDVLAIGGAMANTFLLAQGHAVGKSLVEAEMTGTAREIMDKAKAAGCEILLPADVVAAEKFAEHAHNHVALLDAFPEDMMILDAGPKALVEIEKRLEAAKTLVWNGPLGAFEIAPFDTATTAAARKVAELTRAGRLLSVAGGGDTVAALNKAGVADDFSFVSTAGGAFLEWLEGKTLPGVAALEKAA